MPKQKTHSGAAKRFKLTSSGRIKRRAANRAHILTKRSTKQKRRLRAGEHAVHQADKPKVIRLLRGN